MNLWQWLYDLSFSATVRGSSLVFASIECIHLYSMIFLIAFAGAFDIRLMGFAMGGSRRRPVSELAKAVLRRGWIPLVVNVVTGTLMFASNAPEYRNNSAFLVKMLLILIGVTYHVPILLKVTRWDQNSETPIGMKLMSASAVLVWFGVIVASRWIAYSYV